jgi:hypothetical protein
MDDVPLFDDSRLPAGLDARVRAELRDGERLLWVGQPRPGRLARQGLPIVIFGIPWTAFAVFWTAGAGGFLFGGGNVCFGLFGVPFILVGLGMLTSPYWLARSARWTCYALTDRRAIIWEARAWGGVEVISYGPQELTKLRRVEYPDGVGSLIFEEFINIGPGNNRRAANVRTRGFIAIDNVRAIEELLRKALLDRATEPPGEP